MIPRDPETIAEWAIYEAQNRAAKYAYEYRSWQIENDEKAADRREQEAS
jgi:hypothetical protein